jgi:hypothetical protein
MRVVAVAGIALLVSSAVFAQDVVVAREKQQQDEAAIVFKKQMAEARTRVPIENPVKGAPYSADVVVETSQTLADGNHISHQETSRVYRDSEGRTRREQNGSMTVLVGSEPASLSTATVSIVDPVAGYSYSLDTEHNIAWRTPLATGAALQADLVKLKRELAAKQAAGTKAQAGGAGGGAELKKEILADDVVERGRGSVDDRSSLGPLQHKTIDGIPVDGRVNTNVIPAGAIGNDLPITITSEEWTSPDLHLLVMTRHSDPRSGETTYHVTNIVRADPDSSLFMVPPDYTVKDTGIRRPEPR